VKKIEGTVSLKRPDAADLQVTALDYDGYPPKITGRADRIELDGWTFCYTIER
jgi:hypothetical protein